MRVIEIFIGEITMGRAPPVNVAERDGERTMLSRLPSYNTSFLNSRHVEGYSMSDPGFFNNADDVRLIPPKKFQL